MSKVHKLACESHQTPRGPCNCPGLADDASAEAVVVWFSETGHFAKVLLSPAERQRFEESALGRGMELSYAIRDALSKWHP